jgi:hypothetical protein
MNERASDGGRHILPSYRMPAYLAVVLDTWLRVPYGMRYSSAA